MDAGTRIIGTYQSDVRQGQSRIPSIAVTAWTPQGVPVPLGALVSDELGRVGMPGRVNRHLAERFGGAFMLLLSQGAIDLARSALMQGNGNSQVNLNTGSVQSLASTSLQSTINIPNTVEKNHGERVSFFVTEPVSFEGTYRLRAR
jgi:type IV secretory pathway VirB10-like protein